MRSNPPMNSRGLGFEEGQWSRASLRRVRHRHQRRELQTQGQAQGRAARRSYQNRKSIEPVCPFTSAGQQRDQRPPFAS